MVGFVCNPTTEEEEEEKTQSSVAESNKANHPFDLSLSELEDFSLPFDYSFVDFDSVKGWIEEESDLKYTMDALGENPVGVSEENGRLGVGEKCTEMGVDSVCEKVSGVEECFVKVEPLDLEHIDCVFPKSSDFGAVENCPEVGSDGFGEKVELGKDEAVNVGSFDCYGEEKGGFGDVVEMDGNGVDEGTDGARRGQLGEISPSLEEEMEKVSLSGLSNNVVLVGVRDNLKSEELVNEDSLIGKSDELGGVSRGVMGDDVVDISHDRVKKEVVSDKDEDDSESESESETSSSSSSSSSESSSDEDDEDEEEEEESRVPKANIETISKDGEMGGEVDMEEGEIMASDAEGMVAWSEDEDWEDFADGSKGPIRSKNELMVLPPVPPVDVTLLPHHQVLPIGIVSSVIGAQVIVEGAEKHNPLNEGSILWITESRSPLGLVDEIFGPVKNPYYIVRFNSENEVPAGIQQGSLVSFVPEFAEHVLNNDSLYKKGYDASGKNDEELSDEFEFSDDEKEAEYRRMHKIKKRGKNDEEGKMENNRNDKKKPNNRCGAEKRNQGSSKQVHTSVDKSSAETNQHCVQPGSAPSSSNMGQVLGTGPPVPHLGPGAGPFPNPSNMWSNGIPCQQPFNAGLPPMHCLQQNHPQQVYQPSFPNGVPFQQINIGQSLPSNFVMLGAQSNFAEGPAFAPWLPGLAQNASNQSPFGMGMPGAQPAQNVPNQLPFGMGVQGGQQAPNFMNSGENSTGPAAVFTSIPSNNDASQNFRPGFGRGGGRKSYTRGGGRFGGRRGRGRGRHQ